MLITSHWFACIWGMCADLQGEDYESFTWLDALYYAKSPPGPAGAWRASFQDTLAADDEAAAAADFFYNGTDIVLTRPGDDDTPEFPVQDYESALNRYCAALYWAVRVISRALECESARERLSLVLFAPRRARRCTRSRRSATVTSPRRTRPSTSSRSSSSSYVAGSQSARTSLEE